MGNIIAGLVRATDKVARCGGEELVVLLRETDDAGAVLLTLALPDRRGRVVGGPFQ